MKYIAINGYQTVDRWDYKNSKPIPDNIPIGYVIEIDGPIPESFIKWHPNRIIDKNKYPKLVALFGKNRLPNQLELDCFCKRMGYNQPKETFFQRLIKRIKFKCFK